ncbi:MAG TPA: hypothetical protein VLS89_03075 [Candidatus Nanopelagicales bacterium]|nr:hypothetical protein [Candidatus Nanopelagicales bacterium]
MNLRATLHIRALDPAVVATLEALLSAAEDVRPPEFASSGDLTSEDLGALRDRLAEAIWNGNVEPGQLSLRWLHRESRWQMPTDRAADEFVQVHQGVALLDMLDFLIAGIPSHERIAVRDMAEASDG